ncbi:MAG: YggS family pyridoxal phosphate-dependent enzyme [Candidatus Marisimplicoccus sp.]|tara:strand:- start:3543 stop:4193 length:651 start_codon:yes stop_codon:yes gene_type:complete
MSIKKQISIIKNEIKDRANLIAVSKTRSIQEIEEAYNSGQLKFGENRVQEIVEKHSKLPKDIEWHMIGHLQKNKVKYIAKFITLIHSVDRISLAKEIDKHAKKQNRKIDCLIQLKISREESKFGLQINDFKNFYESLKNYDNLNIIGLMGMATFTNDNELVNEEFKMIKTIYDDMVLIDSRFKVLSIGMSDDYDIALENGSNMIRVGSKIFGKRNY